MLTQHVNTFMFNLSCPLYVMKAARLVIFHLAGAFIRSAL